MKRGNEGEKLTFGEGLAFVSLMLSVSAMDSDSIALPIVISMVSSLALLKSAIKREKKIPTQTANPSGDE